MTFVLDTFTYVIAADQNITGHTGETGATWTRIRGSQQSFITWEINSEKMTRPFVGDTPYVTSYSASGTPPTADYSVEIDIYWWYTASSMTHLGAMARMSAGGDDGYFVGYDVPNGKWVVSRIDNDVVTDLITYTQALTAETNYTVKLAVVGSNLELFVGGVSRGTASDATYTTAGYVGLYALGTNTFTQIRAAINRITAVSLPAAIQAKLLDCAITSFSTGNESFTGAGFRPQLVIFFATRDTAFGARAGHDYCIGAATGATERWCIPGIHTDNGTSGVGGGLADERVIWFGVTGHADFVSMDADGFTIDYIDSFGGNYKFKALCLAGLTNVDVGMFDMGTTTGNKSTTAPGFQPDLILTSHPSWAAIGTPGPTVMSAWGHGLGATDGTTSMCSNVKTYYRAGASDCNSHMREVLFSMTAWDSDTVDCYGTFVSFDTNGFTVNVAQNTASNQHWFPYIAIKSGGSVKVGSFAAQTGTGTFTVTPGFNPKALLCHSTFQTTSAQTAPAVNAGEWAFGMSDGTNTIGFSAYSEENLATIDAGSVTSTTKLLTNYNRSAADTFAATAEIAVSSFSTPSNGFTLDQTDADASAYLVYYVALGDTPAGPSSPAAGFYFRRA